MFDWLRRKEKNVKVYTPEDKPVPVHREIYPVFLRLREPSSSVVLKNGFCCGKGRWKAKLVTTNHASALYDCHEVKCAKRLVKLPLEVS